MTDALRDPSPARPAPRRDPAAQDQVQQFVLDAANLAGDLHCTDVLALDVRGRSDITDYLIIATGTSDRQMQSVGDDIEELAAAMGLSRFGRESDHGEQGVTWLVLDFVDVVVHLFEPMARAKYDLEMLWGDAPRLAVKRRMM